jgi:hypothetical protein
MSRSLFAVGRLKETWCRGNVAQETRKRGKSYGSYAGRSRAGVALLSALSHLCFISDTDNIETTRVIDLGSPQGCESSRLLHFVDSRLTDGPDVVSLTYRPPFTPGSFHLLISVRLSVDPRDIVRLQE